jgi:hypothetical protein
MDNLFQLAQDFQARLSDPEFEAQCDEFNQMLTTALANFAEMQELQRALFGFRNAASALKTQCNKISQRHPVDVASSRVANGDEEDVQEKTGKLVRVQTFMRYGGEHEAVAMRHNDSLLLALLRFKVAAQGLIEEWQETDGTHAVDTTGAYPFQEDFNDVQSKISAWTEAIFRRADGYCVSCCLLDHLQCSLTPGCPCCDMR